MTNAKHPAVPKPDSVGMTLSSLQKRVDDWITQYGKGYFSEQTNTLMLAEEVGEFASVINRVYGQQRFKQGEDPDAAPARLADELGDVLFIVLCLANQLGMSLDDVMQKNMDKKTARDSTRYQ